MAVAWGLILGGAGPLVQAKGKPVDVFFNLGTEINMTPQYWSAGFQVDFHLAKLLMVSPEFNVWFGRGESILVPAILLNFKLGRFFAGAGLAVIKDISSGMAWEIGPEVRPKFDLGYRTRHFQLLVGAIPRNGYVSGLATVGVGF
ncbi:MAG TPA: hypothetical protein VEG35_02215 [Burkholderiales bacterium]|nr:hypothetical protein [Burkholderiales bacterium]